MSDPSSVRTANADQKRPWLAALLALIYPGLGHVYLREWGRALLWFVLLIAATSVLVPQETVPETLSIDALVRAGEAIPLGVTLTVLFLTVLNVADAYWIASRDDGTASSDGATGDGATTDDSETRACPSCGKELDADLDFCHWCTTELDDGE